MQNSTASSSQMPSAAAHSRLSLVLWQFPRSNTTLLKRCKNSLTVATGSVDNRVVLGAKWASGDSAAARSVRMRMVSCRWSWRWESEMSGARKAMAVVGRKVGIWKSRTADGRAMVWCLERSLAWVLEWRWVCFRASIRGGRGRGRCLRYVVVDGVALGLRGWVKHLLSSLKKCLLALSPRCWYFDPPSCYSIPSTCSSVDPR